MIPAIVPANETERLAALRRYEVLDTAPEDSFDRLAAVARTILGTAAAAVSLIDTDRQWFKAALGTCVRQTPRSVAFCAHAILSPEPLVVLDATRDARFHDNPLVTGGDRVRFYAGAPIRTRDGFNVGVLCAFDGVPRTVAPGAEQIAALQALAATVADELELRRAATELAQALDRRTVCERALILSEQRLKDFLDTATDWLWETDESHRFTHIMANEHAPLGGPPFLGRTRLERANADASHPDWAAHLADLAAHRPFRLFRYSVPDASGRMIHLSVGGNPVFAPGGVFRGYRGTGRDVTALVETEAALRDLGKRLAILSASGVIGMMTCAGDRLVEANDELLRILGRSRADLDAGLSWSDLHAGAEPANPQETTIGRANGRLPFFDTECLRKDGRRVPISICWVSLDADRELRMALVKDIGDQKASEEEMRELAFRDSLTGLLNRRSLADEMSRRIGGTGPRDGSAAMLLVDLDYFKAVNDRLGHEAGDALLQNIGVRLRSIVRQDDLVARLGGDEFVLVLFGMSDRREISAIAERIVATCRAAGELVGGASRAGASVGVAVFPVDGSDLKTLLRRADVALYQAKEQGRCSVRFSADCPIPDDRRAILNAS